MTLDDHRLPRSVVPRHYKLMLAPDLEAFTFAGNVVIDVDVEAATDVIVLNAIELGIEAVVRRDDTEMTAEVSYDKNRQRVSLKMPETLAPGPAILSMRFDGILNDHLHGFYRSTYAATDGTPRVIATTQFESTDARRAFPCWDEPDLKATFDITLVIKDGLTAVSNHAEVDRTVRPDGLVEVRFGTTMIMSTYLVAFVIGELEVTEPVDVDGVPLRVVHVPGKDHLTAFALEAGAFHLRYLADYYGIAYPADKLDLIGIPDFTWGAMENLGAVTFRESDLLIDPERATQSELNRVADVIAHEVAHMWFGDLVTMKWWNGIWLNEAFATFMESKAVDAFRPEWRRWLSYATERSASMDIDALASTRPIEFPVESPEEANAMFDALTYGKGSAVVRMLEVYLGEETFRQGVTRYLKIHAHGNTETADLWNALEEVSGQPVGEIMHEWIYRGGHPLLVVGRDGDGYRVEQEQFRYLEPGDTAWKVPALYSSDAGAGRILIEERLDFSASSGLVMNHRGQGFYRVRYTGDLLDEVAVRLPGLEPEEQYVVVNDTFAGVLRGDIESSDFLDLIRRLGDVDQPVVWSAMLSGVAELDRVVSSDLRPDLQRYVRGLVAEKADELGWEPGAHETDLNRRLRAMMLRAMGGLGDDRGTLLTARTVFERFLVAPDSVDNEVAAAAVGLVASNGSMEEFALLVSRYHDANSPQDKNRYLRAAGAVPEDEAAVAMLTMLADGHIRRQDAGGVLALLIGHRDTGRASWERIRDDWDRIITYPPPQNTRRILDLIHHRSEPDVAADITSWLAAHPINGGEKFTAQQLERLLVRVGLRQRQGSSREHAE